ncbi:MAG: tyrosine-type recombinase/integrase [Deltaproteobacteria bacterium]
MNKDVIKEGMRHDYPCLKKHSNGAYYIHYDRHNRSSLKTREKGIAKQKFSLARTEYFQRNLRLLRGECNGTLKEFKNEYLEDRAARMAGGTVHIEEVALTHLINYFGENDKMSCLTERRIKDFHLNLLGEHIVFDNKGEKKIKKGCKKRSVNIYIRHLKVAFKHALKWGYIDKNPYDEFDQYREEDTEPRFFTLEEVTMITSLIPEKDTDFRDMILTYLYTGCRASEVCTMKREDIKHNPVVNRQYIQIKDVKNKKWKYIYVSKDLEAIFERLPPKKGFLFPRWQNPQTVSKKFLRLLRTAGIHNAHLHHTRHTTGSWLAMSGVSKKMIQSTLGHTQASTTDIYMHLSPDYEVDGMDKLNFKSTNATKMQQMEDTKIVKLAKTNS